VAGDGGPWFKARAPWSCMQ